MSNYLEPVIIVSPPRSGSSLTGTILNRLGIFSGVTKAGDRYNRGGYNENLGITELLIKELQAADTYGEGKRFQPLSLKFDYCNFRQDVYEIMSSQGLQHNQPWYYKDPKIAICRNLFIEHFPNAKWVWVNRDLNDTIWSLMQTPFMNAYNETDEWMRFLNVYAQYKHDLKSTVTNMFELDITAIMNKDSSQIQALADYCGVPNTIKDNLSFVL